MGCHGKVPLPPPHPASMYKLKVPKKKHSGKFEPWKKNPLLNSTNIICARPTILLGMINV